MNPEASHTTPGADAQTLHQEFENGTTPAAPVASPPPPRKVSHKGSITGFILALLSLIFSGIANALIHAKYTPSGPTDGSIENEVGHAVATGTTTILGGLFGMMFLVGAIILGLLALVFIIIRLRKVKVGGLIFSCIAGGLAIWSVAIAIGAFNLLKAQ